VLGGKESVHVFAKGAADGQCIRGTLLLLLLLSSLWLLLLLLRLPV